MLTYLCRWGSGCDQKKESDKVITLKKKKKTEKEHRKIHNDIENTRSEI